jgi:hypothetical protein
VSKKEYEQRQTKPKMGLGENFFKSGFGFGSGTV